MAREASLNVSLTRQLSAFVREKVDSGQFSSANDVIRQGLRTMQQQEQNERQFWMDLRGKVKEARTAIANGDVVDGPTFMRSRIAALKGRARSKKPPAAAPTRS